MNFYKICLYSDLSVSSLKKILFQGEALLAVLDLEGHVFVFRNLCSHSEKPLENGHWDPEKRTILCPFHKAIFDVSQKGKPLCAPAVSPIDTFETKIEIENGVQVVSVFLD